MLILDSTERTFSEKAKKVTHIFSIHRLHAPLLRFSEFHFKLIIINLTAIRDYLQNLCKGELTWQNLTLNTNHIYMAIEKRNVYSPGNLNI